MSDPFDHALTHDLKHSLHLPKPGLRFADSAFTVFDILAFFITLFVLSGYAAYSATYPAFTNIEHARLTMLTIGLFFIYGIVKLITEALKVIRPKEEKEHD